MSRAAGPRRWPDLMIGALVLLLLGGFGTLLLRPQAGAPVSASTDTGDSATADISGPADIAVPGAPGTTEATSADTTNATAITPATGSAGQDAPPASPASTSTGAGSAATTSATSTDTPVIAAAPIGTPDPALTETKQDNTGDTEPTTPETESATPAAQGAAAPAARSGGAVPTSEQRTPLRSDYRITLGTFSTSAAAQQAAQGVSAIGYTVYPIEVGAQVVAQVGPFADEATARAALADVQRAYPGAILYPPRDRSLSTSSTPAATTAAPAETTQTTPAEPATPAPTATTPTYLQVGAFDRLESAQNLVQQLRDLGYNPTVNAPAGKKVTVLVGPYTGDPLTRTEARLKANGIDSFQVR